MTTSNAAAAFAAPPAAAPAAAPPAGAAPVAAPPAAAAPPAGSPPAAAPAPAPNEPTWFDGFTNADVKTWTAAKGFKDASAVAESAYNLEKLIGFERAGRTLVVPKDDAPAEEVAAFRAKLGVPATAAEYKLPLPEGSDPKLVETIQGWMFKAGATPSMADTLTKEFLAHSAVTLEQQTGKMIETSDKAFAATTTKWGAEAQANLELGKRFTAQLLPAEVVLDDGSKVSRQEFLERVFNATGATSAMLELFASAGKGLGEHRMRAGGDPGGGALSPQAAQAKISALKADQAWAKAYANGDAAKKAEFNALFAQAYPAAQ